MRNLAKLPTEILLIICKALKGESRSSKSILPLRQTCRAIEAVTSSLLFEKLYLGNSPWERQLFKRVCRDERFSHNVQLVEYWYHSPGGGWRTDKRGSITSITGEELEIQYNPRDARGNLRSVGDKHLDDALLVAEFHADLQCLRECLLLLPNLQKVLLGKVQRVHDETDYLFQPLMKGSTAAVLFLLCELLESQGKTLTTLDVHLGHLLRDAYQILYPILISKQEIAGGVSRSSLLWTFSQLKSLRCQGVNILGFGEVIHAAYFPILLTLATSLQKLSLHGDEKSDFGNDMPPIHFWTDGFVWRNLTTIQLDWVAVVGPVFSKFLEHHAATLRKVSIIHVECNILGWRGVLQTMRRCLKLDIVRLEELWEPRDDNESFFYRLEGHVNMFLVCQFALGKGPDIFAEDGILAQYADDWEGEVVI